MPCEHIKKIKRIASEEIIYNVDYNNVFDVCKYIRLHKERLGSVKVEATMCSLDGCASEEDIRWLRNRISELESSSNSQLVLRKDVESDLSVVRTERNSLQNLVRVGERELSKKNEQIDKLHNQLVIIQTEKDDFKNRWTLSENEVRRVTDLFTRKDEETNRLKNEIRNLKGELGQSREDFLNQKISLKEEKLEIFIQQLGANRGKIMNLINAYKQLLRARNETSIDEAENSINDIKQQLLANGIIQRGISAGNVRKLCDKCRKLAKLKLELNQVYQQQQQQFQAQQEQPTNN